MSCSIARADSNAPIHMCDGLSRNLPRELDTIVANCIAHGRRNFVDIYDHFPKECRRVILKLSRLSTTTTRSLVSKPCLMKHGYPITSLTARGRWMTYRHGCSSSWTTKLVEPNSALGEAIHYPLRRRDSLTLFLRKAGAPLDNNICERALKKAILHRKNSYCSSKTRRGALVGDIYMSLIYSCELAGVSALDYLNQLQLHAAGCRRAARSLAALELRRESLPPRRTPLNMCRSPQLPFRGWRRTEVPSR